MDYSRLLDVTTDLGYLLAMSGAETYRVEETVTRIFAAYGITAEVFAIPNCLHVSLETENQQPLTRMRRIGHHGTDLDSVERYNNISRRICAEKPDPAEALQWVQEAQKSVKLYSLWISILGSVIGASGFILVYGGGVTDAFGAIFCGLFAGILSNLLAKWKVNALFNTMACAFVIGITAYLYGIAGFAVNVDGIMISSLMLLVPGLLFTNAMRDIIYGDTNSGINRIVQVLLVGVAIALGTGAAMKILTPLGLNQIVTVPVSHGIMIESITSCIACIGFAIVFNIHKRAILLCAFGGGLTWLLYRLLGQWSIGSIEAYFIATLFAATYSEIMARIRKQPAISYLVVSIIPLLPGAGVYRATFSIMNGDMAGFASSGKQTIAIAGAIAVGILIISTFARLWSIYQQQKAGR